MVIVWGSFNMAIYVAKDKKQRKKFKYFPFRKRI